MNETLCYNAVGIEQDMACTKILGKLCVCVSTYDNLFFFMNETLCYNAVGIEQDMAWTKILGKLLEVYRMWDFQYSRIRMRSLHFNIREYRTRILYILL